MKGYLTISILDDYPVFIVALPQMEELWGLPVFGYPRLDILFMRELHRESTGIARRILDDGLAVQ